jgi:hypothetical protein
VQARAAFLVGGTVVVAMAAAIVYGMIAGSFSAELQDVLGLPWGRVTLVDLAGGLVLIGAWIAWRERSIARAVPWWIAMVLTGNLASGVYVMWAARSSTSTEELLIGRRA